MLEIILIDDDERFMKGVQKRFEERAHVYLADPEEPCRSGLKLVKDHPDAYVFIDLYIRDKDNKPDPVLCGSGAVLLAETLTGDGWKVAPQRLRFCSDDLGDEVPREVLEKMVRLDVRYVDKAHIVEEIEGLVIPARPLSRARRRRRDEKWCLSEASVRQQYAGQVVAVCDRKVWGSGADVAAALQTAQAQPGCPPADDLLLAVVPDDRPEFFPLLGLSAEEAATATKPPLSPTNA
jgi:hypothetical protein